MNNGAFKEFFALLERMFASLNGLIKAVGLGVVIAVAVLNFDVIQLGFRTLFEKLPELAKVSAFGLGVEFNSAVSKKTVLARDLTTGSLREYWGDAQVANASKGLKSLDKRGLIRLMNVGLLANICQFEKANADILADTATDKGLEEKQLVSLVRNPETTNAVRADIRKREAATGKDSDIGYPLDCYDLKLTDKGHDVRTAIVYGLGAQFGAAGAE